MIVLKPTSPLHVIEGKATAWSRHFVWLPVRSEQGFWIWLRRTWRRRFFAPIWFDPAPWDGWYQYSDERLSFWELHRE